MSRVNMTYSRLSHTYLSQQVPFSCHYAIHESRKVASLCRRRAVFPDELFFVKLLVYLGRPSLSVRND